MAISNDPSQLWRMVPPEMLQVYSGAQWGYDPSTMMPTPVKEKPVSRAELAEAQKMMKELSATLERVKEEPLILHTVNKISKDKKHTFVKKGEIEIRIKACDGLERGDEVLLHPKSMQIVERLGRPPLELSRFAPDAVPNVAWDDIGGLATAKADLREAIELPHKNKELFRHYGQRQIKGILLSGPPGCGKTMLGKAAATALASLYGKEKARTGFLYVKGPEILNQYVGNTEQTIRDIFFDAKRHKEEYGYPAILFLDEADAILAARGTRSIGIGNTIVPQFLTEMDGLEESAAIVIIATNRPDVLDPAVVRDGRIDRKVSVSRPGVEEAIQILYLNLVKVPVEGSAQKLEMAEKITEIVYGIDCQVKKGLYLRDIVNGAMLVNIVNIAVSHAIQRDIKEGTCSGLRLEDLTLAVHRIQRQSADVIHTLEQAMAA